MAIGLSGQERAELTDSEAEALFEEAREIARRRRRRRLAAVSVIATVGIAAGIGFGAGGGSGGHSPARPASSGATLPMNKSRQPRVLTETVVGIASVCSPASRPAPAGDPPPGQCVSTLPNGQRYQCPANVENSIADATQMATNRACHSVASPAIPARWRPTVVRMNRVEACLKRAGLTVGGGAIPPNMQRVYPDTPIAGLLIAAVRGRPTTVNFYLTTAQAEHAYGRTIQTVTKDGQGMVRGGDVLYTWNNQAASQAETERGCLQAA